MYETTKLSKRKSSNPHRSLNSIDQYVSPGLLFKFPTKFDKENLNLERNVQILESWIDCKGVKEGKGQMNGFKGIENCHGESCKTAFGVELEERSITSVEADYDIPLPSFIAKPKPNKSIKLSSKRRKIRSASPVIVNYVNTLKKRCDSCGTRKTPYWRDGWEFGILLCNACGIRFHKYKKYCEKCHCIARKDEKGKLHCPVCFEKLY
jgi:hypothetical protein